MAKWKVYLDEGIAHVIEADGIQQDGILLGFYKNLHFSRDEKRGFSVSTYPHHCSEYFNLTKVVRVKRLEDVSTREES